MLDLSRLRGRFGRKVDLTEERAAFRSVFGTARAKSTVTPNIAEFCGVGKMLPLGGDALQRAVGRREVWDHIQTYLNFTEPEIYAMLKGQPVDG